MTAHEMFEALASANSLDEASMAYQAYLTTEGLPQLSADELLAEDCLNPIQRHAVEQFFRWWSNAQ